MGVDLQEIFSMLFLLHSDIDILAMSFHLLQLLPSHGYSFPEMALFHPLILIELCRLRLGVHEKTRTSSTGLETHAKIETFDFIDKGQFKVPRRIFFEGPFILFSNGCVAYGLD